MEKAPAPTRYFVHSNGNTGSLLGRHLV